MSKTSKLHIQSPRAAQLVLVGVWAGAIGCSSDHALGDLSSVDLASESETGHSPATAMPDFSVPPQLAYPDVSMRIDVTLSMHSAVGVGDLDGDGFDDFVTRSHDGVTQVQQLHVRYGGPRPRDWDGAFTLAESGARLVAEDVRSFATIGAIVPAGDVDGDGYADFLVGVYNCRSTRAGEGAYLFYGGPDRLEGVQRFVDAGVYLRSPRETDPTAERGDCSGPGSARDLGGLGDFDGDGFDDFILSDTQEVTWATPAIDSTAYVFYGREQRIVTGTSFLDADAQLRARQNLGVVPTRDVNGDGLGDLILGGATGVEDNPSDFFWLPGRAQRLDPVVDLSAAIMPLAPASRAGDLDGDGIDDVFLYDENRTPHLFYGALGLFEGGVDFSRASATFEAYAGTGINVEYVHYTTGASALMAGDLDGDGDGELISRIPVDLTSEQAFDVAILSSSHQRLSGPVAFQEPGHPFHNDPRRFTAILPAGDLDGDGATDLLTVSDDFFLTDDTDTRELHYEYQENLQLHIHYGTPGGSAITPLH